MDYKTHYTTLIENCKNRKCKLEYSEGHHIIPKCIGGTDETDNLVIMAPEEHFVAHQLLCKMHPKNHALAKAASMMCVSSSKNPRNNKWYGWIRRKYSSSVSGENNPSAKFTNAQVIDIYHSTEHMDILAERYGVGRYNIITIKRKAFYKSVTRDIKELPGYCAEDTGKGKNRPIPYDLIEDIFYDTGDYDYFWDTYGASYNVVRNIKLKVSNKKITSKLGNPGQVKRYKLTQRMVNDINDDPRPHKEIAEEYGIHYNTVRNLKGKYSRAYHVWEDF